MSKRHYPGMSCVPVSVCPELFVLAASVTDVPVLPGEVKVEDFHNGFEKEENGFKTLDFD